MVVKGITKRWLLNSLGVILILIVALVFTPFVCRTKLYLLWDSAGDQRPRRGVDQCFLRLRATFSAGLPHGRAKLCGEFPQQGKHGVDGVQFRGAYHHNVHRVCAGSIASPCRITSRHWPDANGYGTWTGQLDQRGKGDGCHAGDPKRRRQRGGRRPVRCFAGGSGSAGRYGGRDSDPGRAVVILLFIVHFELLFYEAPSSRRSRRLALPRSGLHRAISKRALKNPTTTRSASCATPSTTWRWSWAQRKR